MEKIKGIKIKGEIEMFFLDDFNGKECAIWDAWLDWEKLISLMYGNARSSWNSKCKFKQIKLRKHRKVVEY